MDLHSLRESPLLDGTLLFLWKKGEGEVEPTGQSSGTQRSRSRIESRNKGHLSLGSHTPGRNDPPTHTHIHTNDGVTEWLMGTNSLWFPGHMTSSKLLDLFKTLFLHLLKEGYRDNFL